MIIGAISVTVALLIYAKICKDRETSRQHGNVADNLIPVAVVAIVLLLLYMLGSVLVFVWGVIAPTFGKIYKNCHPLLLINTIHYINNINL
jgi:fatty-acid desaturase